MGVCRIPFRPSLLRRSEVTDSLKSSSVSTRPETATSSQSMGDVVRLEDGLDALRDLGADAVRRGSG